MESSIMIKRLFASYNLTDLVPVIVGFIITMRNEEDSVKLVSYMIGSMRCFPYSPFHSNTKLKAIIRSLWKLYNIPQLIKTRMRTIAIVNMSTINTQSINVRVISSTLQGYTIGLSFMYSHCTYYIEGPFIVPKIKL